MDIHGYPRKNDMDMDMDMDGIFLIHGKPDLTVLLSICLSLAMKKEKGRCLVVGPYIFVVIKYLYLTVIVS